MASSFRGVVLVKLGGSLITDKRAHEKFRPRVVARLAREIEAARSAMADDLLIGHGAGSFGHAAAARYGVGAGALGPDGPAAAAIVQDRTARLHRRMIDALLHAEVPAFSQAPSSLFFADAGRVKVASVATVLAALDRGLVPVVFGDVVIDRTWTASICSTETAFLTLARAFARAGRPVRRVLWVGITDGVRDDAGRTIPTVRAGASRDARRHAGSADGTDVTGGMAHRLDAALALARLGVRSWIGNGAVPGRLRDALEGKDVPGTIVEPA